MSELPVAFLDWCADAQSDIAVELVIGGHRDWPHVSHLSAGEVAVSPCGEVRIALWRASRGVEKLIDAGRACLLLTCPACVLEIRLEVVAHGDLDAHDALYAFRLMPVEVRDKSAPYAAIISGVRFALADPGEAHARWKAVRRALLAL